MPPTLHLDALIRRRAARDWRRVRPGVAEAEHRGNAAVLDHFAATLPPGEHAVMVMDQAGWHITDDLMVPRTVLLVLLPSYSPELNSVKRVWLYLRERYLSHRLLNLRRHR